MIKSAKLARVKRNIRDKNEDPTLILGHHDSPLEEDGVSGGGKRKGDQQSLVPYALQQPIVPLKTQELVQWLKRPATLVAERVEKFIPDPEADSNLRKLQQTAMEIKISRLFEGNNKTARDDKWEWRGNPPDWSIDWLIVRFIDWLIDWLSQ